MAIAKVMGIAVDQLDTIMGLHTGLEIEKLMGVEYNLLRDEFDETSNTDLDLHNPDYDFAGNGWNQQAMGETDNWYVAANSGWATAGGGQSDKPYINVGENNVLVAAQYDKGDGETTIYDGQAVMLNFSPGATWYGWWVIWDDSNTLEIWEHNPSWVERSNVAATMPSTGPFWVMGQSDGDTIRAYAYNSSMTLVNSTSYYVASRPQKTNNNHGMESWAADQDCNKIFINKRYSAL
jgi:hypothetical protein